MAEGEDMSKRFKRFRKGDLVRVEWRDPSGTINRAFKDAELAKCTSFGIVLSNKNKELRLWTSRYHDGDMSGDDGDVTVVNTGAIDWWTVMARREDIWFWKKEW